MSRPIVIATGALPTDVFRIAVTAGSKTCRLAWPGVVLLGLLLASPARAQQALEPIVVQPPSHGSGADDVQLEDYTGTHSRIDAAELQRRNLTLSDALRRQPGVQARTSGGFGSFASVTVRAASAAQTNVALDGVRLNAAGAPVIDLSTLELLSLASIDIYRGVTPLQLGGGAIGGAVDLRTPRVDAATGPRRLAIGLGSFGLKRLSLATVQRIDRWDAVASVSGTQASNDYPFTDGNGTPLNADDDRDQRRNNAQAERLGGLFKLGTAHGESTRSDLLLMLDARRLGVPEWRNRADNRARFDTDAQRLHLAHTHRLAGWDSVHTGYVHRQEDRYDDRLGQIGLGSQLTRTRTRTLGLDSVWSRAFSHGSAELKAELRRESLRTRDASAAEREGSARRNVLALGTQWSHYPGDGRFVVVPGLHFLLNDDRFRTTSGEDRDRRNEVVSPSLGARFDATERLAAHAGIARYAREPSFAELFVDRGLIRGNSSLRAERGINADAGLRWQSARAWVLEGTVFVSERDELIATVFDARGVGRAINTGRARVVGTEIGIDWQARPSLSLTANLTWQDARIRSANARFDGRQLPGEARLQASVGLQWQPARRWSVRWDTELLRDRFYDSANALPARDSTVHDLDVEYRRDGASLAVALRNLGDDNVEDFNGFPRPGRNVSVHFTVPFEH